ncbi:MAG: lipopolysaccharide biosynthesis protein [Desulfococcaceae bacterium]
MIQYLAGLLTNYLGLAVSMAVQVFLMPFLLHHLGPGLTGLYYLFMNISNFVAIGIGWLAGAGVFVLASSDARPDGRRPPVDQVHWMVFLSYGLYATAVMAGIVIWGALAGRLWLESAGTETLAQVRPAAFYLGLYVWLTYLHQADLALYTARLEQGWANVYRVISQSVFVLLLLVWVVERPRLDFLMIANAAGAAVASIAARLHLRRTGRLGPFRWRRPDWGLLHQMLVAKGRDYFVFGLAQFGLIYGDVLLVGAALGPEAVSAFLVIWKIPEVAGVALGRISEILSPWFTRLRTGGAQGKTARLFLCTSRIQHCLGLSAGLAYALFGSRMVELWVGAEYRPETQWLWSLAGAVLFFQVVNRHDVVLHYALARLGNLIKAQFLDLGLKVLLTLALFPALDVVAPLVAMLAVQLFGLTWFYRTAALRLVSRSWRSWAAEVGRGALPALCALLLVGWACRRFFRLENLPSFFAAFGCYALGTVAVIGLMEAAFGDRGLFKVASAVGKGG